MKEKPDPDVGKLLRLVTRLRGPDGCPWDREQTLGDVRAYLVEEAHETAAAIDQGDWDELRGELGDLLFQVVFIARLASEEGAFELSDVIDGIHHKMIDRHPHVFGSEEVADSGEVLRNWEQRKLETAGEPRSVLAGVPASLPALTGAFRISQKVAAVGFDWPHAAAVRDKVGEELQEIEALFEDGLPGDGSAGASPIAEAVEEEVGDLLFAVASLARHLGVDPEAALARGNLKFRRRFRALEEALVSRGRSLSESSLDELEAEWQAVKRRESDADPVETRS